MGASDAAAATRRAYRSQAARWAEWTAGRGGGDPVASLTDAALAAYLTARADRGAAPATCAQAVAALRQVARAAGVADPYGPVAQAAMRGIRRTGADRGQVRGVRWAELEVAATFAGADGSIRGLRDAAMLRLGSDCLLRVSELAAVQVADLDAEEDGSGRLRIRRSKTDQEGDGATLYVGAPTMAAVAAWRDAAGIGGRAAVPPSLGAAGRQRAGSGDRRRGAH